MRLLKLLRICYLLSKYPYSLVVGLALLQFLINEIYSFVKEPEEKKKIKGYANDLVLGIGEHLEKRAVLNRTCTLNVHELFIFL